MGGTKRRWILPALGIVAFLVLGGPLLSLAGKTSEVQQNDSAAYLPNSAEATQAQNLLKKFTGKETMPAIVVYARAGGLTPDDRAKIAADVPAAVAHFGDKLAAPPAGPFPSQDGAASEFVIVFNGSDPQKLKTDIDWLRQQAQREPGLEAHVTGPGGVLADLLDVFKAIDGVLLVVTAAVILVILIVVYRSPILPFVVLGVAGVALGLANGVVYLLGKADLITLSGQTQGILDVLVLGAGTDYALLLVSRFREELRRHGDPRRTLPARLRPRRQPRPGPGGGDRHRLRAGRHAGVASGDPGAARPGRVLAVPAGVRLTAGRGARPVGPGGPCRRAPPAPGVAAHRRGPRRLRRRPDPAGRRRSPADRSVPATRRLQGRSGVAGQAFPGRHGQPGDRGRPRRPAGRGDSQGPGRAGGGHGRAVRRPGRPAGGHRRPGEGGRDPDRPARLAEGRRAGPRRTARGARGCRGGREGRRVHRDQPRCTAHRATRPAGHHPARAAGRVRRADAVAAGGHRTPGAGGHRRAVVRRHAGRVRVRLPRRVPLRGRGLVVPALRVRVPGRAGRGLQNLPDDPGTGGGRPPRPPRRRVDRARGDRRRHHLGRGDPGVHLRRAVRAAAGVPGRARVRGRVRGAAGHARRAYPSGAGTDRRDWTDRVVARPAVARRGGGAGDRRASHRTGGGRLTIGR